MAIDKNIYNNGIKGLLSYYEIDNLPRDYEIYKSMFKEATMTRTEKPPIQKIAKLETVIFSIKRWWNLLRLRIELNRGWKI